jgi:hypothetical protein
MKKLLTVLLIVSLFSGCQKKKDITNKCIKEGSLTTTVRVISVTHNYKKITEDYLSLTFHLENEETAEIIYKSNQENEPDAEVTISGKEVQIIYDYLDDSENDITKEIYDRWIGVYEATGYSCEQQ